MAFLCSRVSYITNNILFMSISTIKMYHNNNINGNKVLGESAIEQLVVSNNPIHMLQIYVSGWLCIVSVTGSNFSLRIYLHIPFIILP